jgi:hypothetical protein
MNPDAPSNGDAHRAAPPLRLEPRPRPSMPPMPPVGTPTLPPTNPNLPPSSYPELPEPVLAKPTGFRAVERLEVQELKGPANLFTPNCILKHDYLALSHPTPGSLFSTSYQILAGDLLNDSRVTRHAHTVTFIPVWRWSSNSFVIIPIKQTQNGEKVVEAFESLQHMWPRYKVFMLWDQKKRRHIVRWAHLSELEFRAISSATWTEREEVREALRRYAFDALDRLVSANDELATVIHSTEVE